MKFYKHQNQCFSSFLLFKYVYSLILLFFLFLPCLFFCHLDEIVITSGEIRPQIDESKVKALFSGTVTKVSYRNTQFINAGDFLFELDSTYEKQELINLEELIKIYQKEEKELSELLNFIDNANTECLSKQSVPDFSNSKYSAFLSDYKKYQNQVRLAQDNYERQKPLYPNAISKSELETYENTFLQSKYTFISWLENQKIQSRETYAEILKNLRNCQIQIMQVNRAISNSVVFAQTSGYINEINKVKVGDYINEGTPILTIIPDSEKLRCIAFVNSSYISKIKLGQEVIVQINDLPWTKYGNLKGKISLVPQDSLQNTVNINNNFFPVEITLFQNYLQNGKEDRVYLHIGSTANVRIKVSKNTILQKFLQSLVLNE